MNKSVTLGPGKYRLFMNGECLRIMLIDDIDLQMQYLAEEQRLTPPTKPSKSILRPNEKFWHKYVKTRRRK